MFYIGIDLGTTNSAIATFNGKYTEVRKTREQFDVCPSCIYYNAKKGQERIGREAYEKRILENDKVAREFKRHMGTDTQINYGGLVATPEECSAKILQELMTFLPEEIRKSEDKGIVITVPAAFDQRKIQATIEAAHLANIGKVTTIQEPVAAIMKVMQAEANADGNYLIFDMGGGTLDVAVAKCFRNKVDLVALGGVAMCGGADMDKFIAEHIIMPYLKENYCLPEPQTEAYAEIFRRARFVAEKGKIVLSYEQCTELVDSLELNDEDGEEIEVAVSLDRTTLNEMIEALAGEAIACARQTIAKSGIASKEFKYIVFIGGPMNYEPLRAKVSQELGIPAPAEGLKVNTMTAVAEGAAIYAESIDWNNIALGKKASTGIMTQAELGLEFKYEARTSNDQARLAVLLKKAVNGYAFEVVAKKSWWSSGHRDLKNGAGISLPLQELGENTFLITVYDASKREVQLDRNEIVITKTIASVRSILASQTLGMEIAANSLISKETSLDFLIKEGDNLPLQGTKTYRALTSVKAGSKGELNFKVWQGEITTDVPANEYVGALVVSGTDLEECGVPTWDGIKEGEEIIFNYTIDESMSLSAAVLIERLDFKKEGVYDSTKDRMQFDKEETVDLLVARGERLQAELARYQKVIDYDERLDQVKKFAQAAIDLDKIAMIDAEKNKKVYDNLLEAKKLLYQVRKGNLTALRQADMDYIENYYEGDDFEIKPFTTASEQEEIQQALKTLRKLMTRENHEFERLYKELNRQFFGINWERSKKFAIAVYSYRRGILNKIPNKRAYKQCIAEGDELLSANDIDGLRKVIRRMWDLAPDIGGSDTSSEEIANITRG